jgi:hypothetical protein
LRIDIIVGILLALLMPVSAISTFIALAIFVYLFVVHPEPLELGSVVVSDTAKKALFAVVALVALTVGDAFCYLLLNFMITGTILLVHMLFHKEAGEEVVPPAPAAV